MWFCPKCRNEMADQYGHCWQCGTKRAVGVRPNQQQTSASAVPSFTSYEQMEKPTPLILRLLLRRNPFRLPLIFLLFFVITKVVGSSFLEKYGLRIVIVGGVIVLVLSLIGHFRRDPKEGIGVKLK